MSQTINALHIKKLTPFMVGEAEQYVVPNWRAKLNFDKVPRQIAATFCWAANTRTKLRQHFAELQTLAPNCGSILLEGLSG